jgi:hypothetical protein
MQALKDFMRTDFDNKYPEKMEGGFTILIDKVVNRDLYQKGEHLYEK